MHAAARAWVVQQVVRLGPFDLALEIGSRNVNGGVCDLFADHVGLDIAPGDGVDIVVDAATWTPDRTYDCVVSCETFEHTPEWPAILATAAKALRGVLILTMAGPGREPHSAVDGGRVRAGEFYENITPERLQRVLGDLGYCDIELGASPGDLYAVARMI